MLDPEGRDISSVRAGQAEDHSVGTVRLLGSSLLLPAWAMWKEVRARLMAEGQGLIGLSPDGRQLGRGTDQAPLPPLSRDSGDEKAGGELATDGRGTGGIWNEPKGPGSEKMRGNMFCSERTLFTRGDWADWWALACIFWP